MVDGNDGVATGGTAGTGAGAVQAQTEEAAETPPRGLPYPILLHDDVLGASDEKSDLPRSVARRLTLVLQHLGAHGRTGVVKGCSGNDNTGWRRSPLGGGGGNQYYLWWAPKGAPPVKLLEAPENARFIRQIRHHDDHTPLPAGAGDGYHMIGPGDLVSEDAETTFLPSPWTDGQRRFADGRERIRLLQGYPGTGKTSALWQAVRHEKAKRVLYLTWSHGLAELAQEHFRAFSPGDCEITVMVFSRVVDLLRGKGQREGGFEAGLKSLVQALDQIPPQEAGEWSGHRRLLFEELRAQFIGAEPARLNKRPRSARDRFAEYRQRRHGFLDDHAFRRLEAIIATLTRDAPLGRFFPDLEAARDALLALDEHRELPEDLQGTSLIVLDEAQDLTRLEISLLCRLASGLKRGNEGMTPKLLIAGDEAQTVRPTDFRWGDTKRLLYEELRVTPEPYPLGQNVRSPREIGKVLNGIAGLYDFLGKGDKPKGLAEAEVDNATNARIYHAVVRAADRPWPHLAQLANERAIPLIEPAEDLLDATAAAALRGLTCTPEQVKGLDYQATCVLQPGRVLARLFEPPPMAQKRRQFERFWKRRLIDGLRVALSRATETLVLLDIDPEPGEEALVGRLFQEADVVPVPVQLEELVDLLRDDDATAEMQVQRMLDEALRQADRQPDLAERRARQAVALLGDRGLPNGVADETLRQEAQRVLAKTLFRRIRAVLPPPPAGLRTTPAQDETLASFRSAVAEGYGRDIAELFLAVERYVRAAAVSDRAAALWEIAGLLPGASREGWIREGLSPLRDEWLDIFKRVVERPEEVLRASRVFEPFLLFWSQREQLTDRNRQALAAWRIRMVDALIDARRYGQGLEILGTLQAPPPGHEARCLEGLSRFREAAQRYELAGDLHRALAAWRRVPDVGEALRLMQELGVEDDRAAVEWLRDVDALLSREPAAARARLTEAERTHLAARLTEAAEGKTATP